MNMMSRDPNKPFGRPTKYKPEFGEKLITHLSQGFSFESFAALCDCCVDTLYEWEAVHPEFSDAKKMGLAKARYFWEKLGLDSMKLPKDVTFNAAVYIFSMKNKFGWRDKPELILDKKDMKALNLNEKKTLLSRGLSSIEVLKAEIASEEDEAERIVEHQD